MSVLLFPCYNYQLLSAAINQVGSWQGQHLMVNHTWLLENLAERIEEINWQDAVSDIRRFLHPEKMDTLNLWSNDFFLTKLAKLSARWSDQ